MVGFARFVNTAGPGHSGAGRWGPPQGRPAGRSGPPGKRPLRTRPLHRRAAARPDMAEISQEVILPLFQGGLPRVRCEQRGSSPALLPHSSAVAGPPSKRPARSVGWLSGRNPDAARQRGHRFAGSQPERERTVNSLGRKQLEPVWPASGPPGHGVCPLAGHGLGTNPFEPMHPCRPTVQSPSCAGP